MVALALGGLLVLGLSLLFLALPGPEAPAPTVTRNPAPEPVDRVAVQVVASPPPPPPRPPPAPVDTDPPTAPALDALLAAEEAGLGIVVRCPLPPDFVPPALARFRQAAIEQGELRFLTRFEHGQRNLQDGTLPPPPPLPATALAILDALNLPFDEDDPEEVAERDRLESAYFREIAGRDPYAARRSETTGLVAWTPEGCRIVPASERFFLDVRVLDRHGEPAAGAQVSTPAPGPWIPTDADGRARVPAWPDVAMLLNAHGAAHTRRRRIVHHRGSVMVRAPHPDQSVTIRLTTRDTVKRFTRREEAAMEHRWAAELEDEAYTLHALAEDGALGEESADVLDDWAQDRERDADEALDRAEASDRAADVAEARGLE